MTAPLPDVIGCNLEDMAKMLRWMHRRGVSLDFHPSPVFPEVQVVMRFSNPTLGWVIAQGPTLWATAKDLSEKLRAKEKGTTP